MKQIVQPISGGPVTLLDVPCPVPEPTEVLVRTISSMISPGTERAVTALAQSGLVAKARARPDLVRQIVKKARAEGIAATRQAVCGRLAQDVPLGYSAAGVVIEVGDAVSGIRPGQLVATGGAGKANHAEFQAVPGLLCAAAPEKVSAQDAAFTTIAAIALHGLRIADVGPGSKVVVIGLGLIGQLAARLAMAAGCDVAGIDPARYPRAVATATGVLALDEQGAETTERMMAWSRGRGADAVLVCAAGPSSAAVMRVPELCRDRAAVVIVGDVGLELNRTPFYQRELDLRFARSYGPGRYDPSYEGLGIDYPAGQVRWTEGRNFEAVLDLLAAGRLAVTDLVTHAFDISRAVDAYELIAERSEPFLAIRLDYPSTVADPGRPVRIREAAVASLVSTATARPGATEPGVGWVGAGAFSTGTLLPALRAAGFTRLVAVGSAGGLSATRAAQRHGFEKAVAGADAVLADPDVAVAVIATPHDTHASLTAAALTAGRHVWCEKPAALTEEELDAVRAAWRESGRVLAIGFNRRWSPAVAAARRALAGMAAAKLVVYRVAAGPVPESHWYHDRRQGGRLLGEVCHFVDTAQALVGAPIEDVTALSGGGPRGPQDDAVLALRFADGSLATIGYGSAAPSAGKEWIEVHAGEHRIVIDDFRSVTADGKQLWKGRQNKGHDALAAAFRQAVIDGAELPTADMLATMRATITAAAERGGRALQRTRSQAQARHHQEASVTTAVTIDIAGGQTGGAGRYRAEVLDYIRRTARDDIKVIGTRHHLSAAWLAAREIAAARRSRRIALNNVGFFTPGGERWTLLANALHFPTSAETAGLDPGRRSRMARESAVVHRAARRSDVLIAPCTAMAERVATILPDVTDRLVVRMHPLSPIPVPRSVGGSMILCPVIFASYKHMPERLGEWLAAVNSTLDESVRMLVTATASEVPASLAASPRFDLVGRLNNAEMGSLWARSRAVFFPPGLEAFGYALAEARVNGRPVIAQDTPQNREIAGPALCGYTIGDRESLLHATETALTAEPHPDAAPFDPGAYFEWMLGSGK